MLRGAESGLRSLRDLLLWCLENRSSNQRILQIATLCFSLFVLAELVGSAISNSLSLLGDAAAMSVDVFAYAANMYAEHSKERTGLVSERTRLLTGVVIPFFSVLLLLSVTSYVMVNAILVLGSHASKAGTEVNVGFLYGFASANLLVDLLCFLVFFRGGSGVFLEQSGEVADLGAEAEDFDAWLDDSDDVGGTDAGWAQSVLGKVRAQLGERTWEEPSPGQQKNLNMVSAGAHVLGDSLRTLFMFLAALVSSVTGLQGAVCDAWGAVAVSVVVLVVAVSLIAEIYQRARSFSARMDRSGVIYRSLLSSVDEMDREDSLDEESPQPS